MRIFGAFLLVAASVLLGIMKANKLQKRSLCLSEALDVLRFIKAELNNLKTPIPELFSQLAIASKHGFDIVFEGLCADIRAQSEESLSDMWTRHIMNDKNIDLSHEQRLELCRPGTSLGRYDCSEQSAAIESCIIRLESEYLRADRIAREGKRLYMGLGLAAGLMLATVLI